jgi:hypothetical protein
MQAEKHFFLEEQCLRSLEQQKLHMQDLIRQAGQGTITVMEGICADAQIKARIEKITQG